MQLIGIDISKKEKFDRISLFKMAGIYYKNYKSINNHFSNDSVNQNICNSLIEWIYNKEI